MGSNMAVAYANCFMSCLLFKFLSLHPQFSAHIPYFRRFLDDMFGFWNGSKESFQTFVSTLNAWSRSSGYMVQFKISAFGEPCAFLDVEVFKRDDLWHTRLYAKPTDVHAYLSPNSWHPEHVFRNIPFGVAIRIRRICSLDLDFLHAWAQWRDVFFARRGYNKDVVDKAFRRVWQQPRSFWLAQHARKVRPEIPPFVVPYNKATLRLGQDLRDAHCILQQDLRTARSFSQFQSVVDRRGRMPNNIISRAALNPPPKL